MRTVLVCLACLGTSSALPPLRRLSEVVGAGACNRTGIVVALSCPTLFDGDFDVRAMCTTCDPSLLARLAVDCADEGSSYFLWSYLCTGDCAYLLSNGTGATLNTLYSECESACTACFSEGTQAACATCPSECIEYVHCWDDEAQAFTVPPARPPSVPMALFGCTDLATAHDAHGCCASGGGFADGGVYVRIA
jgi:hypothetical protein